MVKKKTKMFLLQIKIYFPYLHIHKETEWDMGTEWEYEKHREVVVGTGELGDKVGKK